MKNILTGKLKIYEQANENILYILTNEKYTYRQMKNIHTDKLKIYLPTNEKYTY